jgi:hypothetical protein
MERTLLRSLKSYANGSSDATDGATIRGLNTHPVSLTHTSRVPVRRSCGDVASRDGARPTDLVGLVQRQRGASVPTFRARALCAASTPDSKLKPPLAALALCQGFCAKHPSSGVPQASCRVQRCA